LRNVEVAREILYAARLFNESHEFVPEKTLNESRPR
jgi:hypothetical protein